MHKTPSKLLDEILAETKNYRCQYLQVLIEKYVNTQDEGVDILLQNFTFTKPTNYLKKIKEKPFGYVSSYDCKSAKKPIKCWKKKVILQKRASFRKYVGVLSSDDYSANLKYLSTDKAYKTLLSTYSDKSFEECESTLLNETELGDDEETIAFTEEDESILFNEDCSILPGAVTLPSKKRQNKISATDEPIKTLATKDKYSISTCNVQELPNFQIKNCYGNLLKPNNHKKLNLLIENFSTAINNSCNVTPPKIVCQKISVCLKAISSPESKDGRNSVSSVYKGSNDTLFHEYISSKSTPKFKFSDIGLGISNKNNQISSFCDTKSLPYTFKKSTEISEIKPGKIEKETQNKNSLVSSDYAESLSGCSTEFLKSKSEKVKIVAPDKNCPSSNDCNSKLSYESNKSNASKVWSRKDKMATSNEKCQITSNTNTKSLSSTSNGDIQSFKLRLRKVEKVISGRNCQMSSDCDAKSLRSSNMPTHTSKLRPKKDGKVLTNKNCQFSTDCNFQSLSDKVKEFIEDPKSKPKEQTSNNDSGVSNDCDSKSLSYASSKPFENTNFKSKENKNPPSSKNYEKFNNDKLSNASDKPNEVKKLKSKEDGINENIKPCKVLITKLPYELSNCNQVILRSKDDKTLASNKNDQTFSSNNVKSLFSVSDKSDKDPNFKPKEDRKQKLDEKSISDENYKKSNNYSAKLLSSAQDYKATEVQKLRSKESEMTTYESCEVLGISSSALSSCSSKKSVQFPKTKSVEERTEKCLEASNVSNASDTSVKHSKHKYSDDRTRTSNKNRQTLNSFPLRCTSLSSSFGSNLGVSAEIDPLSRRSVSGKKKFLSQSSVDYKITKSFKKYLDDGVKIDDLSLRDFSSPLKTRKNRHK